MSESQKRTVNRALLAFMAGRLGHADDLIGYVEELMLLAAGTDESAQTLADMVERDARRLQDYWGLAIDAGVTPVGRAITDEERDRCRKWHEEITDLLQRWHEEITDLLNRSDEDA